MIIDSKGQKWYKGNLHTHTTVSDGVRTPEEVIALYREKGYDFLAITDHWHTSENRVTEDGMLLLSGCEFNVGERDVLWGVYHLVGLGFTEVPALTFAPYLEPQKIIDEVHRCGGLVNLAHPAWSLNTPEQIVPLQGIDLTEIFNSVSDTPWNARPYSGYFVDIMATRGHLFPCIAADDAHFYEGDETKSYVMVRADSLSRESILSALRSGDFYATQGPSLRLEIDGGVVRAHTSPVEKIIFYSNSIYSTQRVAQGHGLTEATYHLQPVETFIRAEAIDKEGRTAWTSPLPVHP